jgi:hypothetical protein
VILGCTEIELLVCAEASHVPVFPATRVHVGVAITAALDGVAIGWPVARADRRDPLAVPG